MSSSMDVRASLYDEYYYKEWDRLEKELNEKPLDPKIRKEKKIQFSDIKREALAEGTKLKMTLVSPALWVEKMAERTKELASVVLSADKAQMKFEEEQASAKSMELFKDNFTKEGAFKLAEGVADISAYVTAGGAIGGAINPVIGRGLGILAGATAALVKQVLHKDKK